MLFLTANRPRHSHALDNASLRPKCRYTNYLADPASFEIVESARTGLLEKYPLFISISHAHYRNERARRLHKIIWQKLKSSTGISRIKPSTKRLAFGSDRGWRHLELREAKILNLEFMEHQIRKLTISSSWYLQLLPTGHAKSTSIPLIRLQGIWLQELGFKEGGKVTIWSKNGQLIITPEKEG